MKNKSEQGKPVLDSRLRGNDRGVRGNDNPSAVIPRLVPASAGRGIQENVDDNLTTVIPAQAGIQKHGEMSKGLDSGLHRNDIPNPKSAIDTPELDQIEIEALLEALHRWWGYDFRNYAPASLKRRLMSFLKSEQLATISGLQEKALHDWECLERLLLALSVNVTAMFREPPFFTAFREFIVPFLKTYPFVRIWCAGCSTGEEAYSLAILLKEEDFLDRCQLYATDMNEAVLKKARGGIYPLSQMKEYTTNYLAAGGTQSFSDYYTSAHDHVIFDTGLKRKIVWAQHNLVTDASFNEFHVIICRNVMIYFNKTLQDQVHRLFYDSLVRHGVLGLGEKETIRFSPHEKQYAEIEGGRKLYRRTS